VEKLLGTKNGEETEEHTVESKKKNKKNKLSIAEQEELKISK
jgi:hypothetical protein